MFYQFALTHAWLIPLLPAISFLVIGLFTREDKDVSAKLAIGCSSASFALAVGVALAVWLEQIGMQNPYVVQATWAQIGSLTLAMGMLVDPMTAMMLLVVTTVALLVQIYSVGYMAHDPGAGRFFSFLSLFAAAMLGLVLATNFLQMYVFWELVGACSYLLIGFYYYKVSAREAAKKAFITTRIGDFGMLLGILLLQVTFSTTDFQALQPMVQDYIAEHGTAFLTVVGVLLFIGPIGKSGQFPLHVWLPDAMEGPTPVSALIHAATMVVAGVYLIGRGFFLFSQLPTVMSFIAWTGGITAIFAASIALTQTHFKRILAYSTISQLGYMILALGVGSLTASMFHLMTHAFFKALLFLCAGAVIEEMHEEADIFKMGGLKERMPVTCAAMTIGVLAIAGIPPFAGFFSKDAILAAAAEVSLPLYALASVTAFMTSFYMARLLFVSFYGPLPQNCPAGETNPFMRYPLLVLAALAVLSGLVGHVAGFGDWIYFGEPAEEHLDLMIAGSSTGLAALAIGLAYLIYVKKRWSAYGIQCRFGLLYKLSYNKYYIDEMYTVLRRYSVDALGRLLYWLELNLVCRFLNKLAEGVAIFGTILTLPQDGQAQRSVKIFYCGVLAVMVYGIYYAAHSLLLKGGVL